MKYKSCKWIESGINFDINSYKVCCTYSPLGGGNITIDNNYKGKQIDWENVFSFKQKIRDIHKSGEIYPNCKGCIFLEEKDWDENNSKIDTINLDYWTKCNSKCSYCFTMKNKEKYNKFKNYNFLPALQDMIQRDILRPTGHISFGGGEVTLLDEFEQLLNLFIDFGFQIIKIHTSGIIYSKAIEKGLKSGIIELIVSVDSGTKEMHKKIKGVDSYDTVWNNLKKYASVQKRNNQVITKYILIPGINDREDEIDIWLEKSKENRINSVFQEIESKWFYARRDNVPDNIIEYFHYAKNKAESLGLKYELYERAKHMMSFRKEKNNE